MKQVIISYIWFEFPVSKMLQNLTICSSSSNCDTRRYEVNQKNALSVPENTRHNFFAEIEFLGFLEMRMVPFH